MTDRYAVIGHPIAHSKSPLIHKMFAAQTGHDMSYEAIEAPLDGFAATVERLRREGYKGCNVTVPFKQEAFALADSLTNEARHARAANTLSFNSEHVRCDNTDGIGLIQDITKNLHVHLGGKRVLLIGAGGASRGVLLPLMRTNPKLLCIVNRTEETARLLLEEFRGLGTSSTVFTQTGFQRLGGDFDVVINATSAGLTDSSIPLPKNIFAPNALAYDMMYGRETPFMAFARAHGAQVADGLGMLVEQAAEAFFIWRGVRPDTHPVLAALRHAV